MRMTDTVAPSVPPAAGTTMLVLEDVSVRFGGIVAGVTSGQHHLPQE